MKMLKNLPLFLLLLLAAACNNAPKYNIGVSQCSEDDWRALLNLEIQREARFQGDMNVEVLSADDNSEQQIADIEQFIDNGKDLIIVAPNVAEDVRPVIEKAFDKGIPVILIDRKTTGDKFTAFIGANNQEIGEQIGEFLNAQTDGKAVGVVELRGLNGSSPEKGRHGGFFKKINGNVSLLASVYANWNEADARTAMDSLLRQLPKIDYVYAHNDRMAKGALSAIEKAGRKNEIKVIGIDALLFDGGGVDMVMNHDMLASFIYPTGGSEAIILAKKILQGEPFERETVLASALVDEDNARVMKMQYRTMQSQDEKYQKLETLNARQLEEIITQKWMLGGATAIVCLLALVLFMQYKVQTEKKQADDMLMQALQNQNLSTIKTPTVEPPSKEEEPKPQSENADTPSSEESEEEPASEEKEKIEVGRFWADVEQIIISHIGDNNFSVNDIANELGLSRVQLYRKIKSISDHNINELIRNARLEKARELLTTTNKSVSEVAYAVGFSSPSYFTRCYKEFFGVNPSRKV